MITADELRKLLDYNPATGGFTWRVSAGRAPKNSRAGRLHPRGYIDIKVCKRIYKAHRLAWLYVHGEWPPHEIDHINRDQSDNRLSNLRSATRSQNGANRSLQSNNTSGLRGVTWCRQHKRWKAQIKVNGKHKNLGLFSDKLEAARVYRLAAAGQFGAFAARAARIEELEADVGFVKAKLAEYAASRFDPGMMRTTLDDLRDRFGIEA